MSLSLYLSLSACLSRSLALSLSLSVSVSLSVFVHPLLNSLSIRLILTGCPFLILLSITDYRIGIQVLYSVAFIRLTLHG